MNKKSGVILLLSFLIIFVACSSKPIWKSEPSYNKISNASFDATITPLFRFNGYKGFIVDIHNRTSGSIKIDWSNTYYVHNGNNEGGFWFEGIQEDEEKKIMPTVIPANEMLTKELYPAKLRVQSALAASYVNENMMPGKNGIHLTVDINGEIVSETQTFTFSDQ